MSAGTAVQQKKQSAYLIPEAPLFVLPTLATALGINKAVVFQQLHLLLNNQKTSKNDFTFVDGHWWVYNSYAEWQHDYFPWLSIVAIKGIFRDLEKDGLIVSQQSVKYKSDRRKWYRIDYEVWDKKYPMMGQNLSHEPSDKKYPMMGQNLSDGLSDITSESTDNSSGKESPPTPIEPQQEVPEPAESKAAQERGGEGERRSVKSSTRWRDVENKWLYERRLITDERFNGLNGRDQNTAIFNAICWYITKSVSKPEDVYARLLRAKREAKTLEHRYLSALSGIEGSTALKLRVFVTELRQNEYGAKLQDPEKLAHHYRLWLRGECTLLGQKPAEQSEPAAPRKVMRPLKTCPTCKGEGSYPDPKDRSTEIRCDCWHEVVIGEVAQ